MYVLLILMLVSGCMGSTFDDNAEERKKPALKQSPTPEDDDMVCKTSCVTCSDWQWGDWSPAASTVCKGENFIQQRSASRTCTNICPDVQCILYNTEKEEVQGVKECDDDDNADDSIKVAQQTCAEACQAWKSWSAWSLVGNNTCPSPDAVTRPPDLVHIRSRSRTCSTVNLQIGLQCPTSNHERMRQALPLLSGQGTSVVV